MSLVTFGVTFGKTANVFLLPPSDSLWSLIHFSLSPTQIYADYFSSQSYLPLQEIWVFPTPQNIEERLKNVRINFSWWNIFYQEKKLLAKCSGKGHSQWNLRKSREKDFSRRFLKHLSRQFRKRQFIKHRFRKRQEKWLFPMVSQIS